jgi:hypothetical protein
MNGSYQSEHQDVLRALKTLHSRTIANLQEFNNAVPHASWLRRSEIALLTNDLLYAAKRTPRKRQFASFGKMMVAFSRFAWVRAAVRPH